jgi:hypothetical protein
MPGAHKKAGHSPARWKKEITLCCLFLEFLVRNPDKDIFLAVKKRRDFAYLS